MKKTVCLVIILGALSFGSRQSAAEELDKVGRFQLVEAKYQHWDLNQNGMADYTGLFLVDTMTGNVQAYVSTQKDGKQKKYWAPTVVDEK